MFRSENSFLQGLTLKNLTIGSTFIMPHPAKNSSLILNKIWKTNSYKQANLQTVPLHVPLGFPVPNF